MITYKEYQIPNTIDEIIEINKQAQDIDPDKKEYLITGNFMWEDARKKDRVATSISIEDMAMATTDDAKRQIVNRYFCDVKDWIDHRINHNED